MPATRTLSPGNMFSAAPLCLRDFKPASSKHTQTTSLQLLHAGPVYQHTTNTGNWSSLQQLHAGPVYQHRTNTGNWSSLQQLHTGPVYQHRTNTANWSTLQLLHAGPVYQHRTNTGNWSRSLQHQLEYLHCQTILFTVCCFSTFCSLYQVFRFSSCKNINKYLYICI